MLLFWISSATTAEHRYIHAWYSNAYIAWESDAISAKSAIVTPKTPKVELKIGQVTTIKTKP